MDKMVYGQNDVGQNGAEKMVRIKWYTDKISNQTINPTPTDNIIFSYFCSYNFVRTILSGHR